MGGKVYLGWELTVKKELMSTNMLGECRGLSSYACVVARTWCADILSGSV